MPRCIVVDDHADSSEGIVEYLRASGFAAEAARDADEFRALIRGGMPDAIVMDLQLPGIDGFSLMQEIRAAPTGRTIPIVVVSACVFPDDRAHAEAAGADAFLEKPCDPAVLAAELQRLLGV